MVETIAVGLDFLHNSFYQEYHIQTDRGRRNGHSHLADPHIVSLHILGLGTLLYVDYSMDSQHSVADTFGLHNMDSNKDACRIAGGGAENVLKMQALVGHSWLQESWTRID